MNFSRKKLSKDAAADLRALPVDTVRAYALMPAPVYVYLRSNEKFVSIKAPLDFFTPDELRRMRKYETFYLPKFVDEVTQYREGARAVRALLTAGPDPAGATAEPSPTPFAVSDAVLRKLGPLWNVGGVFETFFAALFCDELCAPLPPELLNGAHERSVETYERAVLQAATVTFLALHLGYSNLDFLNVLRLSTFERIVAPVPGPTLRTEVMELTRLVGEMLRDTEFREIRSDWLARHPARAAHRLVSRLARIDADLVVRERVAPSIFGERGFADV